VQFNEYSVYYDLLYKDKNYYQEVEYIINLFGKYSSSKPNNILDIGCGTGIHASILADKGYNVTGIDLSESMIKIAQKIKNKNLNFLFGDARSFKIEKKFDTVLSLFHVASYQTTNEDLNLYFSNVSNHLIKNGLFIFDCWYGPAVLTNLPSNRVKRLENEEVKITRIAEPVIYPDSNCVDVNYEIFIENKKNKILHKINETHKMRYLFKTEIDILLVKNNLSLLNYEEWITSKRPGFDTWGVCFVCQKN